MNRRLFAMAFAIGLAAVAWVGWGFLGTSWLALAMTAVIGTVFAMGALELRQFRSATSQLSAALADIPQPLPALGEWLEKVPAGLRGAVRLRIEGERVGLPGPSLTPYLVGLLVMLGMLGTFLGMVVTFKGAVFALEGSTDLQAIRSALADPIRGLGLSFGTSVAGVATSAMLGLMSAVSRRERVDAARQLDARIATTLLPFSLVHQRQETLKALQVQARALPEVVGALDTLMSRIEQRSAQLDEQLLARQADFQREVTVAYTALADRVGTSLKDSVADSARAAGESIGPVVATAMQRIVQDTERLHQRLGAVAQEQVDALSRQFSGTEAARLQAWTEALHGMRTGLEAQWRRVGEETLAQQRAVSLALETTAADIARHATEHAMQTARLLDESGELVRSRAETEARWVAQHGERMDELAATWRTELAALRDDESVRGQAAVDRLGELQAAVAQHLATLGAALEAPIARLLQTASEVPQAAAGVITQLRQEMGRVAEKDNLALQERTVLLGQLGTLLQTVNQASGEQRAAIDAIVASAATVMDKAGSQFVAALDAHAGKAGDMAAQVAGSAIEVASLAEAFGAGVQSFQASNDKLAETLLR
ncbi:MAG: hypothetical protein ACJ8GO_10320, partial [Ramlibacter sp.]